MQQLVPIRCLSAGETAEVHQVVGQPEQVHRLEELGLRDGTQIEMLQPGSPCIIRLDGQRLCFRDGELLSVLVRTGESV